MHAHTHARTHTHMHTHTLSLFLSKALSLSLSSGIPTTPVILLATSEAPGEVLLIVQVRAAGVGPSPHSLVFDVLAVQGTSVIDLGGVPQPNYVDGTPAVITIKDNRLEPNQTYSFHVRVRNTFGASEYTFSTLVTMKGKHSYSSENLCHSCFVFSPILPGDSAGTSDGSSSCKDRFLTGSTTNHIYIQ